VLVTHDVEYAAALRLLTLGRKPVRLVPVSYTFDLPLGEGSYVWKPQQKSVPRIAYFGGIDKSRGLEDLLLALSLLRTRDFSPVVLMVGQSEPNEGSTEFERRFAELLKSSGLAGRFEWTGYLSDREAVNAIISCDIGVLPFRRNSIGRTTLATFLAVGLPTVLCAPRPTFGPMVSGKHAVVVRRRSPRDLAAAIDLLASDVALQQRVSAGAREASRWFSWDAIVAGYRSAYEAALNLHP
jgi:glycosyltransferase involved in cell wall biosynthesis